MTSEETKTRNGDDKNRRPGRHLENLRNQQLADKLEAVGPDEALPPDLAKELVDWLRKTPETS